MSTKSTKRVYSTVVWTMYKNTLRRSDGASGERVEAVRYASERSAHERELELTLDAERALQQLGERGRRGARARRRRRPDIDARRRLLARRHRVEPLAAETLPRSALLSSRHLQQRVVHTTRCAVVRLVLLLARPQLPQLLPTNWIEWFLKYRTGVNYCMSRNDAYEYIKIIQYL